MSETNKINLATWLIIIGLATVLLYAAFDSFTDPEEWIGYFPHWMRGIVSDSLSLNSFSIFEIALSFWLLSRKYLFYSGIICALLMLGIVVFNPSQFGVTFRDIGIFFAALALSALNYKK